MSETETESKTFQTFRDFCDHFGLEPRELGRAFYKATACGVSFTVYAEDGTPLYADAQKSLTFNTKAQGVAVSSIVEGSDVEVSPRRLDFPFTAAEWEAAVEAVEEEADFYWRRDNLDHFCVTRPGVMQPDVVESVDAGWGEILFGGNDGTGLTTAERLAVTQALTEWQDEDGGPQPGQKRKVGDLTIECYSQEDFIFD